ncbi:MAG: hypothetical protein AAGA81_07545 [Acidobacteriota bacterium]
MTGTRTNAVPQLRPWLVLAIGVAILGLGVAFIADGPWFEKPHDDFNDAWREIGGATFAGALIAILVLVFEERREEERVEREEARETRLEAAAELRAQQAAVAAWRREIDIQLVRTVRGEMDRTRGKWRKTQQRRAAEKTRKAGARSTGFGIGPVEPVRKEVGRTLREVEDDVVALLQFLREDVLDAAWDGWDVAAVAYQDDVTDAGLEEAEERAWSEFLSAVSDYVDRWYPTEAA